MRQMQSMMLALALAAACSREAPQVRLENAWTPGAVSGADVTAVYLDITSPIEDVLLSASSPMAQRVEMHLSSLEDGMMRMRPLPHVELPAGQTIRFEPQGRHFMVMGLKNALHEGAHLQLQLTLQHGGSLDVQAAVHTSHTHTH